MTLARLQQATTLGLLLAAIVWAAYWTQADPAGRCWGHS